MKTIMILQVTSVELPIYQVWIAKMFPNCQFDQQQLLAQIQNQEHLHHQLVSQEVPNVSLESPNYIVAIIAQNVL